MKKDIHPKYNKQAKIICACGKKWTFGSTVKKAEVEICSACHPFYTGKQKMVDTAGKVEKFKARAAKTKALKKTLKAQKKVQIQDKKSKLKKIVKKKLLRKSYYLKKKFTPKQSRSKAKK